MRTINSHKVNGCNEAISITVKDQPGQGGASHLYNIEGFNTETNPSCMFMEHNGEPAVQCPLLFQNGPPEDVGTNGITQEVLLAIVIDRLECFQKGQYACRENALALTKIQEAVMWLQKRTNDRMLRGVEGTHVK